MESTKEIFIKRLKSFAWRLGSYALVALLAFFADNLDLLHLAPQYTTIIALVLGEITKALNTSAK